MDVLKFVVRRGLTQRRCGEYIYISLGFGLSITDDCRLSDYNI